jgi:surfeit locus 1 family protein
MITITGKRYCFTIHGWLIVLTACGLWILLSLSHWQYERYLVKQHWQQELDHAKQQPAQPWNGLENEIKPQTWQFKRVRIPGHYLEDRSLLLDNQTQQGRVGYHVLTPFLPDHAQQVILVDRGWIPAPVSRQQWPRLPAVIPQTEMLGFIKFADKKPFLLAKPIAEGSGWPKRIPAMDMPFIAELLGQPLQPFIVLLDNSQENGFLRNWSVTGVSPARHLGYAIQWLVMAIVLCVIFIALNLRKVQEAKST